MASTPSGAPIPVTLVHGFGIQGLFRNNDAAGPVEATVTAYTYDTFGRMTNMTVPANANSATNGPSVPGYGVAEGVRVQLLADRGFGDQKLYELLKGLAWDYTIRFRGNIEVESRDGEVHGRRMGSQFGTAADAAGRASHAGPLSSPCRGRSPRP